ncbi:MAG: hypothetical protein J6D11_08295 [Clostridia bacterium]|nr:hypothetical protein [Clostridia bacterium]
MNIVMEEKKYSVSSYGNAVARAYFLYPRFPAAQRISDFYAEMAEELHTFFEKAAGAYLAEYENMARGERKNFEPLCIRLFSSAAFAEEEIASIVQEYAVSSGKELLFYRKFCQVWDTERELLLPPRRFLSRRDAKKAEKNEFYINGEHAVIVENLFPQAQTEAGRRIRLCDYTRETKREIENISSRTGEQS